MVQNKDVCAHIRYDKLSLNVFKLYLLRLSTVVETNIAGMIPETFALIFDRWTALRVHKVAVFATFPNANGLGYGSACLELSLLEGETSQNADNHKMFLKFALSVFVESPPYVVTIIGDNCNVNGLKSTKLEFCY